MVTGTQIAAAREHLEWSQSMLAKKARRCVSTVMRSEAGTLHATQVPTVMASLQRGLEAEGIEFLTNGQQGAGIGGEMNE